MALALAGALVFTGVATAITPTINEFSAGLNSGSNPTFIAPGADGNLWFTDQNTSNPAIGRITLTGAINEFTTGLNPSSQPVFIAPGPDGNLWFTDFSRAVWRINPTTQKIDAFSTGLNAGSQPHWITAGADGNLWFTDRGTPKAIGRINPTTQKIDEFSTGLPAGSLPTGITAGPDGNLWFTDRGTTKAIARINPTTHKIDEFSAGLGTANDPQGIVAGSDGNLWFTDFSGPAVGRFNRTAHKSDLFKAGLKAGTEPTWIAAGPDGQLWFTDEGSTRAIGRITTAGAIKEFTGGLNAGSNPGGIAAGADGNVWFADGGATNAIGRITTPPMAVTRPASVLGSGAAKVLGTVNGHAQATSYRFEYGRGAGYGSITSPVTAGAGFENVAASTRLSGLKPHTTYHYRVDATNPTGTTFGGDATFTTRPLPLVRKLRIRPGTWRLGSKLVHLARRRPPVGTRISFLLNRVVPVRLRFFVIKPGRKVKGKCQAPTSSNAKARTCQRPLLAGSISLTGKRGKNTLRFEGRVSTTTTLKPGRYRLRVTATDPTTPTKSSSRTAAFTIVKG